VFALGQDDEDKEIWFRTGVTATEPELTTRLLHTVGPFLSILANTFIA
jgi:hypothetical protein